MKPLVRRRRTPHGWRVLGVTVCLMLMGTALTKSENESLIWAGRSGQYPKYIESGPSRGMGWLEVPTTEIRKSLREAGFTLKVDYMTPARIAFEFQKGNPICMYPEDWQDPESTFKIKPDRVYSIPLEFKGEEGHSIMIHRDELPRFKKYQDAKGDIQIEKLLKDTSLKTLLVQNGDYGLLGKRLTTLDEKGDQVVRPEYARNIAIRVIRDSLQLLEMLNSHRFDYIFSDSIEEADFEVLRKQGISKDRFLDLRFDTHPIRSIQDPRIVRTSVTCSLHPTSLRALPYINKKIKLLRSNDRSAAMNDYRKRLDPRIKSTDGNTILRSLSAFLSSGMVDDWYPLQQRFFPELRLFPAIESTQVLTPLPPRNRLLEWHAISVMPGVWTVLSDAEVQVLFEGTSPPNFHYVYARENLSEFLNPELKAKWLRDRKFSLSGPSLIHLLTRLQEELTRVGPLKQLTFFAGSLNEAEVSKWVSVLKESRSTLASLSVFDASPGVAEVLTRTLPDGLERLNLTNSSLSRAHFHQVISGQRRLKELRLDSTQIPHSEFESLVSQLPSTLETLSLGYLRTAWTPEALRNFSERSFPNLKAVSFEANALSDEEIHNLRRGLPKGAVLKLGGNLIGQGPTRNPGILSISQGNFRNLLTELDAKPKALSIKGVSVSEEIASRLATLPQLSELEEFQCSECQLDAKIVLTINFKRWRLRRLDLSKNWIDDASVGKISAELPSSLRELDLSSNIFGEEGVRLLCKHLPLQLEKLSLSSIHGIDLETLGSCLPKTLLSLDLSSNGLSDKDVELLAPRIPSGLRILNLQGSSFGPMGAWNLAKHLPPHLVSLDLGGVPLESAGLEVLASQLPQSLSLLKIGGFAANRSAVKQLSQNLPSRLTSLTISQSNFEGDGLQELFQALPRSLQGLFLFDLKMTTKAALALGSSFPEHLRDFEVQGTNLTSEGVVGLVTTLPATLEDLWLMALPLGKPGMVAFSKNELPHLFKIAFDNDDFGKESLAALNEKRRFFTDLALVSSRIDDAALDALGNNTLRQVKSVWMGNQPITGNGLARFLKKVSPSATLLHIPSLKIQPTEVDVVIRALPKGLRHLVMPGNPIGQKGYEAFRRHAEERRKAGVELNLIE